MYYDKVGQSEENTSNRAGHKDARINYCNCITVEQILINKFDREQLNKRRRECPHGKFHPKMALDTDSFFSRESEI